MWEKLPTEQKERYKKLMTNFASLSEAFSQKTEDNDDKHVIVAPIVNSKFQETVFQRSFNALSEDIANTSYDASLQLDNGDKFLVGIKAFGIQAGDQKIAQFKKNSGNWADMLNSIQKNAQNAKNKAEADKINEPLYLELAEKISHLRNDRIASSKAQIKGFQIENNDTVNSVYHVLMTSGKNQSPQITVGETEYLLIDTENLNILGSTTLNNPNNFKFSDKQHTYKYTAADSQLLMAFDNKNIALETWDIDYIKDPFAIFENLHELTERQETEIETSVSWIITDESGELPTSSGYNAFDGTTKLAKPNRETRIKKIATKYKNSVNTQLLDNIINLLEKILLENWTQSQADITARKDLRDKLMNHVEESGNSDLKNDVIKLVYRSAKEVYIPISNSREFHNKNPNFFGQGIGTFQENSAKLKLPKEQRTFKLTFIPSGNTIEAYINQDDGKAIQSIHNQDILGEWLLRGVFQLKERELLTAKRLDEIGINAIRLIKYTDKNAGIGLKFIWIDENNPPNDAIGWVAKNK